MKKSELKTGMIVTIRDGIEYVVFKDFDYEKLNVLTPERYEEGCICNEKRNLWTGLCYYAEDLTYCGSISGNGCDIMKVEMPNHPFGFMNLDREERRLLWKREEIKEVTMAEVEAMFGCKVKIINES